MADLVALAGLDGLERRLFGDLSGGQQRRVLFAIALCGNPELLFFDEPTTGLDVEVRRGLWSTLRSLAASGRGVVLTTHYLEEADALADRVVVLHHGHVIAEGTPTDVKSLVPGPTGPRPDLCRRRRRRPLARACSTLGRQGPWLELLVAEAEPVVCRLLDDDPAADRASPSPSPASRRRSSPSPARPPTTHPTTPRTTPTAPSPDRRHDMSTTVTTTPPPSAPPGRRDRPGPSRFAVYRREAGHEFLKLDPHPRLRDQHRRLPAHVLRDLRPHLRRRRPPAASA